MESEASSLVTFGIPGLAASMSVVFSPWTETQRFPTAVVFLP